MQAGLGNFPHDEAYDSITEILSVLVLRHVIKRIKRANDAHIILREECSKRLLQIVGPAQAREVCRGNRVYAPQLSNEVSHPWPVLDIPRPRTFVYPVVADILLLPCSI